MQVTNFKVPFRYERLPMSKSQASFLEVINNFEVKLLKYKNEIETIRDINSQKYKLRHDYWIKYFDKKNRKYDLNMSEHQDWEAINFYTEGLKLFALNENLNAVLVVHLMTNAILHASTDKKVLICCYIMRSKALYQIADYRHSFEDGKVAANYLEVQHVMNFLEHVLALKVEDAKDMKMEVLVKYMQKKLEQHDRDGKICPKLKEMIDKYKDINEPNHENEILDKVTFHNKKIVAKKLIKVGAPILCEAPYAIYAYADNYTKICAFCGNMHWVTYPCHRCGLGKVTYCSPACKNFHDSQHKHECDFFKLNLHMMVSIETVLAFRTTIYGFIEILPFLRTRITASNMWSYLFGEFYQQEPTAYAKFLKLCPAYVRNAAHNLEERAQTSLEAEVLITFLLECPSIAKLLESTRAKKDQWLIFLNAMLLYNIEQIKVHARGMVSILDYNSRDNPECRFMTGGGIGPGFLSDINKNITQLAIAVYCYIGRCATDPSKHMTLTRQNCRTLNMYAVRDIRRGEEIFEFLLPVQTIDKETEKWIKREFELIRVLLHPSIGSVPMDEMSLNRLFAIGMNALMKIKNVHGHLSPTYIKYMLYVWDVLALGKIQIESEFINACLEALQTMSNLEQDLIMTYFQKYLQPLVQRAVL